MKKEERIRRYGKAAYLKRLDWSRKRDEANPEKVREWNRKWREANPDKVATLNHKHGRKGGKYYEKALKYQHTGLPRERNKIRCKHGHMWREYKNLIAPESQLHHQWHIGTSEYDGVALAEKDQHLHGIVNVIEILEGAITVFTEKELQGGLEI